MPGYVAGVTAPQYGMPISGTPIGLAGPPHVPLGVPAGLQEHTMVNHTHVCLPQPVKHERIDVRQEPGISYPEPANHARIVERTSASLPVRVGPLSDRRRARRARPRAWRHVSDRRVHRSGGATRWHDCRRLPSN